MDYSTFVSIVNEQNRPSGGIRSIYEACNASAVRAQHRVLEIGCNTGFTAGNIAFAYGCKVVGIDTNKDSIAHAKRYVASIGVDDSVELQQGNGESLVFEDDSFDVVWLSNVPSFTSGKIKMISEAVRVLKPGGRLIVIPIYYTSMPPKELIAEVGKAIGSPLESKSIEDWIQLYLSGFERAGAYLSMIHRGDFVYDDVLTRIPEYVDALFGSDNRFDDRFDIGNKSVLRSEGDQFYRLFNENLKYCGYSIVVYFKQHSCDQIELFTTRPA